MKHEKIARIVSNILFGAGAALGAAALIKSYIDSANLPPGVCPFDQNRWLSYTAIGVLAASLVLSFVGDWLKRRRLRAEQS
jgi:hypothetical protein